MGKEKGSRLIANNKKAYHDYFIEEKYEAGISLHGTEMQNQDGNSRPDFFDKSFAP